MVLVTTRSTHSIYCIPILAKSLSVAKRYLHLGSAVPTFNFITSQHCMLQKLQLTVCGISILTMSLLWCTDEENVGSLSSWWEVETL